MKNSSRTSSDKIEWDFDYELPDPQGFESQYVHVDPLKIFEECEKQLLRLPLDEDRWRSEKIKVPFKLP